jgi:hypothetical protein
MATRAGKHQTVFASGEEARAESAWGLLHRAGYHPLPISSTPHPPIPGCRVILRVDVPVEEMRAAREVLAQSGYEPDVQN